MAKENWYRELSAQEISDLGIKKPNGDAPKKGSYFYDLERGGKLITRRELDMRSAVRDYIKENPPQKPTILMGVYPFSDDEYRKVQRCLHPDSRNSLSDTILAEAFDLFTTKKSLLASPKFNMPGKI